MKNLIKISIFFASIILFTGSAYADSIDDFFAADRARVDACIDSIPKIQSPSGMCQWYRNMFACPGISSTDRIDESDGNCTITSDIAYNGTQRFYYSGNLFCSEGSIGTPRHTKKCVPRTDGAQPTSAPKLAPTPESQSKTEFEIAQKNAVSLMNENKAKLEKETKRIDDMMRQRNEKDAAKSQLTPLQTFNDALDNFLKNFGTFAVAIKNLAGSIFDGAKSFFKK